MGTKADHDLWGQALAIENRYGDRGPDVLKQKIVELRKAGEPVEAAFWAKVAECLNDLHAIRFEIPTVRRRSIPPPSSATKRFQVLVEAPKSRVPEFAPKRTG